MITARRAFLIGLTFLFAGCATRLHVRPNATREEQWEHSYNYLVRIADGGTYRSDEFERAVFFFENETGIDSGLPKQFVGLILDRQQLRKALQLWGDWWRVHKPVPSPARGGGKAGCAHSTQLSGGKR